jgi:hypothetical protein
MFLDKLFRKNKDNIVPREDLLAQATELGESFEDKMKKKQDEYLLNFDKEILKAAQEGRRQITSFRCDSVASEPWETRELLDRMEQKYSAKGFKVKLIQPYLPDSQDCWLRIIWNDDEDREDC